MSMQDRHALDDQGFPDHSARHAPDLGPPSEFGAWGDFREAALTPSARTRNHDRGEAVPFMRAAVTVPPGAVRSRLGTWP